MSVRHATSQVLTRYRATLTYGPGRDAVGDDFGGELRRRQTTLATGLAHELNKRGHAVELVSEQVYFERDDLRFLADAYLTKHLPTAADPLEGLSRLTSSGRRSMWS